MAVNGGYPLLEEDSLVRFYRKDRRDLYMSKHLVEAASSDSDDLSDLEGFDDEVTETDFFPLFRRFFLKISPRAPERGNPPRTSITMLRIIGYSPFRGPAVPP